nr:InlB B-repeat-containing protein [Candidatus Enterousia merdequi]
MKKIFLTSALAISMIVPAMAETTAPNIAAGAESATCDSGTLNTTDGTSTLSAQWTANTINLKWYNGETEFATNTCTYDGGITLPASEPTKTGYNFAGWQVKQALFDLRTLADKIDINGESRYARVTYENADHCFAYGNGTVGGKGPDVCTEESTALSDISMHQWKTKFSYGTVKGIARCSTTPETDWGEIGNPADSGGGGYCWCQASGYDAGNSGSYANVSSPSWVFSFNNGDAGLCAYGCANSCASRVQEYSRFRSAVFGVSNN